MPKQVDIIIDVFRAFSAACTILEANPSRYFYTKHGQVIKKLKSHYPNSLLVGKNECGMDCHYTCPNSPTRLSEISLTNQIICHRSEAGATGILQSTAPIVLAASFVNAAATVRYVKSLQDVSVNIIAMGHEATTDSLEDTICAEYIDALISQRPYDIQSKIPKIIQEPGNYFFSEDQWQYPQADLARCLDLDAFEFAIQAISYGSYAELVRCD